MSTTTDIATLRTALETYTAQITDTLASAKADVALDVYIDAYTAYANIAASAASSYNNVSGGVTKRAVDDAKAARDAAWGEFTDACAEGSVVIPGVNQNVGSWRLT